MGHVRIPPDPKENLPNGKFSGKKTCGKTTAMNGDVRRNSLLMLMKEKS
jgi:hypothetical protein